MKSINADAADNMKPCVLYRHAEDEIAWIRIVFGITLNNFARFKCVCHIVDGYAALKETQKYVIRPLEVMCIASLLNRFQYGGIFCTVKVEYVYTFPSYRLGAVFSSVLWRRFQRRMLMQPFFLRGGRRVLSIPVDIFHPYRTPLLQITLGFLQVGAFGGGEFCKVRIPCEDKTTQKFVCKSLF